MNDARIILTHIYIYIYIRLHFQVAGIFSVGKCATEEVNCNKIPINFPNLCLK